MPTAILVEVDHSNSTQLPLGSLHSPPVLPSSPSPCPNSTNTIEQEESLALNQSVNSSTIEPAIESSVKTTSLDSSKFRDSYLESEPNVDSTDMVDGLTEKFYRSRLLELGDYLILVFFHPNYYAYLNTIICQFFKRFSLH